MKPVNEALEDFKELEALALKCARELFEGAAQGQAEWVSAALAVPAEQWPPDLVPYVAILRELRDAGTPIDEVSVTLATQAKGLPTEPLSGKFDAYGLDPINVLVPGFYTHASRVDAMAKYAFLRKAHEAGTKIQIAANDPATTAEDLRHLLADIDLSEASTSWQATDLTGWQDLAKRPISMIFENAIPRGNLSLLVSEGGTGKSFIALQMALALATGYPVAPGFEIAGRGKVLALFGEDAPEIVSRRIAAICEAYNVPTAAVDDAIKTGALTLSCLGAQSLLAFERFGGATRTPAYDRLADHIREARPDLIIIDPLLRWSGVLDENSNAAFEIVARTLLDLATLSGGAVLCLHHANKRGLGTADQSAARGGSSLACAARWSAGLRTLGPEDAKTLGIAPGDAWRYIEFAISKNSYAARAGSPTYLRRGYGGVIVPAQADAPASIFEPKEVLTYDYPSQADWSDSDDVL